ncbi:MAG TPA: NAD(P)-binding domain-containing protein, partial [Syntrophorhabdales bacterium]|nr:NAD(P)-binding domain-containing protein [Syntrophorhabdales bacterium]
MKIGIIGAGKVGIALGHVLQNKGFAVVAVASRRDESLELARNYIPGKCIYTKDVSEVVRHADVVAVTTRDREIHAVAKEI